MNLSLSSLLSDPGLEETPFRLCGVDEGTGVFTEYLRYFGLLCVFEYT